MSDIIINYSLRNYGDGGPHEPQCRMVKYVTDPTREPPQWQETLYGREKQEAMQIIARDRELDEPIGDYVQKTINEGQRWYMRTSKRSGNSWEVVLDEDNIPLPDPCDREMDPRPGPLPPGTEIAYSIQSGTLRMISGDDGLELVIVARVERR